jgi:hypothetical protein
MKRDDGKGRRAFEISYIYPGCENKWESALIVMDQERQVETRDE